MMTEQNALLAVFERNQFYRRQYLLALGAFGLSLLILMVLVWVLVYVVRNPPEPLYFAADNVGRLIEVVPVSRPNMSNEDVSKWTVRAVEKANSYDYVNFRQQMQAAQQYFTEFGWKKFMEAFKASKNLEGLTINRMIFEAKVIGEPKLITEGLLGSAYAWKFEMPMLVTYWMPPYDDKSKFPNALNVTVIVQRQSILQSNDGLGILQLVSNFAATADTGGAGIASVPTG
jgi:intracellular multiplication protein IcmL